LRHRPGPFAVERQPGLLRAIRARPCVQPAATGRRKGLCARSRERTCVVAPAGRRAGAGPDAGAVALSGSGRSRGRQPRAAPRRAVPARTGECISWLVSRQPGTGGRCRPARCAARAGAGDAASARERTRFAGRERPGEHVMAARRGKSQARRNGSNGLPGWAWLVIGVLVTLAVVLAAPRLLKSEG